jgi:hypothetical protein
VRTRGRKRFCKLWIWYREGSETARALIKRRDYLILLGLAKRKTTKKAEAPK